jgi:hypothetical protein
MANPDHLAKLKVGFEAWNKWRKENPDVKPDLSSANLEGANLKGAYLFDANLDGANLSEANLKGAYLFDANLFKANLKGANLSEADLNGAYLYRTKLIGASLLGANLSEANLEGADLERANLKVANLLGANLKGARLEGVFLSGATVNKRTISNIDTLAGIEIGVNGFYSVYTDSAALMQLAPPGNSMQGTNADVIVESLKHARKLHNISLSFSAVALLVVILRPKVIKLPLFPDFSSDATHFAVLAILCSIGVLTFTESFIRAAIDGAQYIRDRDSAMKVGHFPWTISKYDRDRWGKRQSLIMRIILCFHPLVYPVLYLMLLSNPISELFPSGVGWLFYLGNVFAVFAYFALLALCVRIFWLSQQFQKAILSDPQTEINRKSEAMILNKQVEGLNEKMSELIELLKPTAKEVGRPSSLSAPSVAEDEARPG